MTVNGGGVMYNGQTWQEPLIRTKKKTGKDYYGGTKVRSGQNGGGNQDNLLGTSRNFANVTKKKGQWGDKKQKKKGRCTNKKPEVNRPWMNNLKKTRGITGGTSGSKEVVPQKGGRGVNRAQGGSRHSRRSYIIPRGEKIEKEKPG